MRTNLSSFSVLIFLLSFTEQTTAQQGDCPPWFILDNISITGCSCHHTYSDAIFYRGPDYLNLHFGYCMTYNDTTGATAYGACPYIAHYSNTTVRYSFYIQLPSNVSLLNEYMCGPLNREGPLCGKCNDGYGTALYSYTLECSKCSGHGYGWSYTISWNFFQ